jgi:hypothetical protein
MEHAITRMMAAVFGPSLSKRFNWYGKKHKLACKDLRIADVIFGAISYITVITVMFINCKRSFTSCYCGILG